MTKRELINKLKENKKNTHSDLLVELEKESQQTEMLFSNYDYIDWLISFTEKYNSFVIDDYDYEYMNLSNDDRNNLDLFPRFFDGVVKYANKNYIYPFSSNNSAYYRIKYNDIALEIGARFGQGTIMFCSRSAFLDEALEFTDIVEDKESPAKEIIEAEFLKLFEQINKITELGVPFDSAIEVLRKLQSSNSCVKKRKK